MFDFYQKRKLRTILNSPYTQVFLLFLSLLVGWSAYVRYEVAMEMFERREQAELEATALRSHKEELEDRVKYISSKRGQEAELRRQFDVALPGEKVVVIVDDKKEDEVKPLSTTTPKEESKKWYQFWR